ncbi:hypothetical protein [Prevotella pallens]|nr:hypothetical protein [Prevotella pallens]MBF1461743.1 hypothetical protein [Prevotella pallens]
MLGYGHDESAPTPFGVFVGCFCGRSLGNSWLNVNILQSVRHIIPIR